MTLNLNKKSYTEVPETLRPQKGKDIPVTKQKYIEGGFQTFTTVAEAEAFPIKRRVPLMYANIKEVLHVMSEDLSEWIPADKGYMTFNPGNSIRTYFLIYNFNFRVIGHVSNDVEILESVSGANKNTPVSIKIKGNSSNAVITFEIVRWL